MAWRNALVAQPMFELIWLFIEWWNTSLRTMHPWMAVYWIGPPCKTWIFNLSRVSSSSGSSRSGNFPWSVDGEQVNDLDQSYTKWLEVSWCGWRFDYYFKIIWLINNHVFLDLAVHSRITDMSCMICHHLNELRIQLLRFESRWQLHERKALLGGRLDPPDVSLLARVM